MHNKVCLNIKNFKVISFFLLERARANEATERENADFVTNTNPTTNSGQLLIPDESTLSRLDAPQVDRPISQPLMDENLKLSITKQCCEDQLRLKGKRKNTFSLYFSLVFRR